MVYCKMIEQFIKKKNKIKYFQWSKIKRSLLNIVYVCKLSAA